MQVFNKKRISDEIFQVIQDYQDESGSISVSEEFRSAIEQTIDANHLQEHGAETKYVSILLSDLRGFVSIAEKFTPTAIIQLLNHYFTKMSTIIDRHGGVIDKFMGDSIMVLFGTKSQVGGDLKATIRCAIEMQIAMSEINELSESLGMSKMYMGIGINTGEVVAGTLGSDIHREYTVIGDEVNLASRLEAQSLRGQILLSENTYTLASEYIQIGSINEVNIKGKRDSVKMYELMAINDGNHLEVPQREIRTSPRIQANFPMNYHELDGKNVLDKEYSATVIDISYGGLYILTEQPIIPFTEIKMEVSLSLMKRGNSVIYARVLNCNKIAEGYESNVEFTSIGDQARQTIKSFVDSQI